MKASHLRLIEIGFHKELLKNIWEYRDGNISFNGGFLNVINLIQKNVSKKSVASIKSLLENMPCMKANAFMRIKRRDGILNLEERKIHQFQEGEAINYLFSQNGLKDTELYIQKIGTKISKELVFLGEDKKKMVFEKSKKNIKQKYVLFENCLSKIFSKHMKMIQKKKLEQKYSWINLDSDWVRNRNKKRNLDLFNLTQKFNLQDERSISFYSDEILQTKKKKEGDKQLLLRYTYKYTDEMGERIELLKDISNPKILQDFMKFRKSPSKQNRISWESHNISELRKLIKKKYMKYDTDFINDENKKNSLYNSHIERKTNKDKLNTTFLKKDQNFPKLEIVKPCERVLLNPNLSSKEKQDIYRLSMCKHFLFCLKEIRKHPQSNIFENDPSLTVKDYKTIIFFPMCLKWIQENVKKTQKRSYSKTSKRKLNMFKYCRIYKRSGDFLEDVSLIHLNSLKFNGKESKYTNWAKEIFIRAKKYIENDKSLKIKERTLNKINQENKLSANLIRIINLLKKLDKVKWFFFPVSLHKYPDYSKFVQKQMCFKIIEHKISSKQYGSLNIFMKDLKLIYHNSRTFNGKFHIVTLRAKNIIDFVSKYIKLVLFKVHVSKKTIL